jgi:hypothetical protein
MLPIPVVEYFVDYHQSDPLQGTYLDIANEGGEFLDDLLEHPLGFILLP